MSPAYDVVPHRLIGNFSISGADSPENAQVTSNNAGGYGTCDWDQRTAPGIGAGDLVTVISEGAHIFEGHVQGVTTGVGPVRMYHVSCLGRYDKLRDNEALQAVFVDRDLSQLQTADCGWSSWSEGQIAVDTSTGVRFTWPTVASTDPILSYVSAPKTYYDHVGNNLPPGWHVSDFPVAEALWSAAYYQMAGGQNVTGLSFVSEWYLALGPFPSLKTIDYDVPIGPPDASYGRRFNRYHEIETWGDFYGIPTPQPFFAGVYACDDPEDLPTYNPQLMYARGVGFRNGATCLFMMDDLEQEDQGGDLVKLSCNDRTIVFYAGYLPFQMPRSTGTMFSKNADHLVRTKWVAENQYFCPPCWAGSNQIVDLTQLQFFGMGYHSKDDGSDDLRDVFGILFPTCECDSMIIPATPDLTTGQKATTSIAIRTPTSELAAIPNLLGLYPTPVCWGVWEDNVLKIEHDMGNVALNDEPGVDTTGASQTSDGALDYVVVDYLPLSVPDPNVTVPTLSIPQTQRIIVDALGEWELADLTETFAPGLRIGYLDATQSASSPDAAALQGQILAASRLPYQWTGTVRAQGIAGASTFRPGKTLDAPGIDKALITQVQVDVTNDAVNLALGSTGYYLRFPLFVPGKPLTANPLAVKK